MHQLLSVVKYATNHGFLATPADFYEFPSQLMENWAALPETFRRITTHWSSFSEQAAAEWRKEQGSNATDIPLPPVTLPEDLISQILNNSGPGTGSSVMSQLGLTFYDQVIHNVTSLDAAKSIDVATTFGQTYRSVYTQPDATDLDPPYKLPYSYNGFQTIFTHLVEQYAAAYYSYQWCLVYAQDVFYTAFSDDPFSSTVGMRYRTQVLQPGGSVDPLLGLKAFLGRDPNNEGYYTSLGINSTSSG